jgi:acyl carrier protein
VAPARPEDAEENGELLGTLRELWTEALGLDEIGPDDDFFDVGGDSMIAVQLSARIRQRFGVEFSAATMFEADTIRRQAEEIAALVRG